MGLRNNGSIERGLPLRYIGAGFSTSTIGWPLHSQVAARFGTGGADPIPESGGTLPPYALPVQEVSSGGGGGTPPSGLAASIRAVPVRGVRIFRFQRRR